MNCRNVDRRAATLDMKHVLHPWADMATLGAVEPLVITGAKGARVLDAEGKSYLDAIGGMWCMTLGYGHEGLITAMTDQARRMPYYTPFGAMTSQPASELAGRLAGMAPGDLTRVHFTTGGSTAVELALRFVHYYFTATGRPQKRHIISRRDAYHGGTYLAASVSGKAWDRTYFAYEENFVHLLTSPNPSRRPAGVTVEAFCDLLIKEFEELILRLGPENVACFIAEPILASGGVIVPPQGYQRKTLDVCRKHGILDISDEVVTGFGRLGHFFASEPRFDVVPDLLVIAKGLTSGYIPLGAVMISERLVREISGANAGARGVFTNGFTYSGHPVACAVASANISFMEQERICDHVREIGPYFIQSLNKLRRRRIVGDIRGDHLMACVECSTGLTGDIPTLPEIVLAHRVDAHCQKMGLLIRPYESLCILSPPLVITRAEIDELCEILDHGLELTERDLMQSNPKALEPQC